MALRYEALLRLSSVTLEIQLICPWMKGLNKTLARNVTALTALTVALSSAGDAETLSEQLQGMATEYDFQLTVNIDVTKEPARRADGSLAERLDLLLSDFNHVITTTVGSGVERVIVLSRKQRLPPRPNEIILKLQHRGMHHLVSAILVGWIGAEIQFPLIVDTGSTFVVLPRSQIPSLGLAPDQLDDRQVQTANGQVTARVGQIPMIRIGSEEIADVQVAFIDDAKLGGNALLGMSVLSRYKQILDDEKGTLTLILKK